MSDDLMLDNDTIVALIKKGKTAYDLRQKVKAKRDKAKRLTEEADILEAQAHLLAMTTAVVNGVALRVHVSDTIYGKPGAVDVHPMGYGQTRWAHAWLDVHSPQSDEWRWNGGEEVGLPYLPSGRMTFDEARQACIDYVAGER